jgi:hypothetical protein
VHSFDVHFNYTAVGALPLNHGTVVVVAVVGVQLRREAASYLQAGAQLEKGQERCKTFFRETIISL